MAGLRACFALCLGISGLMLPQSLAEDLAPIDEGWIRLGTERPLSKNKPLRLSAWGFGKDKDVRITYLKFDFSALPANAQLSDLVLQSAEKPLKTGVYMLYGLPGGDWDSASLNGQYPPGWDAGTKAFSTEVKLLTEAQVSTNSGSFELRLPVTDGMTQFVKENSLATFILVKKGEGGTFACTFADPEKGPRLQWH